jgi:DNA polymerase III subunit delta
VADLKPVYLVGGSDRPKVERALHRLRARVGEAAVETLSAREASGDDAVSACNTLGLFVDSARLVVVDDVGTWKAPDVKAVAAYLADPAPATVLALVAAEVKRDSPLAKACAKAGDVLVYEVTKRELPRWVAAQFGRLGARAEPGACRLLVELVGENVLALETEVEKLAAWAGDRMLEERDVEELVVPLAETPGFRLTDAWARRDAHGALDAAERMLEQVGARRDQIPRLAGMLGSHVARVRECRRLSEEGMRPRDAAARMRRSPYYVQKLFEQAERLSADELDRSVVLLAALDHALKGGSRLSGELELDRALVAMTAAGGSR